MANENVTRNPDGTTQENPENFQGEFVIQTNKQEPLVLNTVDNYFDLNRIASQNLLRSCKFAIHMLRHPNILIDTYRNAQLKEFTFLCDSLELPGRTTTTTEFQIPGTQKIKTPYRRDFNEITLSFYHNTTFPIYQYFIDWIDSMSSTNTQNAYFDDLIIDLNLIQFKDDSVGKQHTKYKTVSIFNAYPTNVASLPCNWADDGFHKLSVTMFYEFTGATNRAWREGRLSDLLQFNDADLRDSMKEYADRSYNKTLEEFKNYRPIAFDL